MEGPPYKCGIILSLGKGKFTIAGFSLFNQIAFSPPLATDIFEAVERGPRGRKGTRKGKRRASSESRIPGEGEKRKKGTWE